MTANLRLADRRRSGAAARDVLERLLPDAATRARAIDLLASAIRHAYEAGPSCWVITLFDDFVRLNVGPAEMLTIRADGIRLVLHRDADWQKIKRHVSDVGKWGVYTTLKDSRVAFVEASRLSADAADVFKDALALSARVAAEVRSKTTWAAAHSEGVIDYLESFTASSLPRPMLDFGHVDPYALQMQFDAFRQFVSSQSGLPFRSFASDPYVEKEEGYKRRVAGDARAILQYWKWKTADVGSGRIIDPVIQAIEVPENNLVRWQPRSAAEQPPHHALYESREDVSRRRAVEDALFALYQGNDEEARFGELVELLGARYPLIAYLFFIKDPSRYLPLAPRRFDRAFELLGIDFKTSNACEWANYVSFVRIVEEIRELLIELLQCEVALLDAHSFLWILTSQMREDDQSKETKEYLQWPITEREAITKARIGQGAFRTKLLEYWGATCAVTGCAIEALLCASHIKPWKEAPGNERVELFNGLLLSPALDKCFDRGYVSFDDQGRILISRRLSDGDLRALGIDRAMKLRRIDDRHRAFLADHRRRSGLDQ